MGIDLDLVVFFGAFNMDWDPMEWDSSPLFTTNLGEDLLPLSKHHWQIQVN